MKLVKPVCLLFASLWLSSAGLVAQEPAEAAAKSGPTRATSAEEQALQKQRERDISYLPSPLSVIRCNVLDLERTGYFAIDGVALRTRTNGDEAIVWTVRVKKAVTCRHTEALLREFRDARFYSTIETQTLEVITTLVYYPERISLGSSSNQLLRQDDVFELWIDLPKTYLQKLISLRADRLVLRRWKY